MSHAAAELSLWNIVVDDPALDHAASVLRENFLVARLAEGRPAGFFPTSVSSAPGAPTPAGDEATIHIGAGDGEVDGFRVEVEKKRIRIKGSNLRGAINGACWLLEQLGILWVKPGEGGRPLPGLRLETGKYEETPAFARRTLILGNDALHDDWRDWMEFASRNRVNDLFFHDTPPSRLDRAAGATRPETAEEIAEDGRGWLFELWERDGEEIVAEAKKRGMTLQFGGHHLPSLLPRDLFAEHPDWFPLRAGERNARYNLCTSSSGARDHIRQSARDFFQRFAGADVYHLWADDIRGGGWCECSECARLSPSDQALRATNLLADVLAEVAPGASIAHLAYHDTIEPPSEKPRENVVALYAPRSRNYAYAIDDKDCPRNARDHWEPFQGLRRTFGDSKRIFAFEYYSDAILFKWMAPTLFDVLPADARAYAKAGIGSYGNLAVTPRPWPGANWHVWWWARCAWNPTRDAQRDLEQFCAAAFGKDAAAFVRMFQELDAGYRLLLDLGDLEQIARHDVLDFSDRPREALAAKARQMHEAIPHFEAAAQALPLAPDALGIEGRAELSVQVSYAVHLANRVIAWDAALAGRQAEAREALANARLALSAVEDWHNARVPAGFANLSRGMLRAARWHTDQIAELAG